MIFNCSQDRVITVRALASGDENHLCHYLLSLSEYSKKVFQPHGSDAESVHRICRDGSHQYLGFIAEEQGKRIVGYFLYQRKLSTNDGSRLKNAGVSIVPNETCSFAPSLLDEYHGTGLAHAMFHFAKNKLSAYGIKTIVLLGGVEQANARAVAFYTKLGFRVTGEFARGLTMNYMMMASTE